MDGSKIFCSKDVAYQKVNKTIPNNFLTNLKTRKNLRKIPKSFRAMTSNLKSIILGQRAFF